MSLPNSHLSYEFSLSGDHPILQNHHVHGRPLVPGVTWLGLICEALMAEGLRPQDFVLEDVVFREALALDPGQEAVLRVFFDASDKVITIANARNEVEHCRCRLVDAATVGAAPDLPPLPGFAEMIARPLEGVYETARELDITHGDWMRGRGTAYLGDNLVVADLELGADAAATPFALHPALLDCATVTPFAAGGFSLEHRTPAIPLAIGRARINATGFSKARVVCSQSQSAVSNSDIMHNDLWLVDSAGAPLVVLERLSAKRIRSAESLKGQPKAKVAKPSMTSGGERPLEDQLAAFITGATGRDVTGKAGHGFYELGFDSGDLMGLASALEHQVGRQFYPTLFYEQSSIEKLAVWLRENGITSIAASPEPEPDPQAAAPVTGDLMGWLQAFVQKFTEIDEDFAPDTPFYDLGLNSAALLALSEALEAPLGATLYPTLCYEHGSVAALAAYLEERGLAPVADAVAAQAPVETAPAELKSAVAGWTAAPLEVKAPAGTWAAFAPSAMLDGWTVWDGSAAVDGLIWDVPAGQDPAQTLATALNLAKAAAKTKGPISVVIRAGALEAAALVPFLRSVAREMPRLTGRVISGDCPDMAAETAAPMRGVEHVRYSAAGREVATLSLEAPRAAGPVVLDGAVVLTGGTGAIAQHVLSALFAQGHRAFALIARSAPTSELETRLSALRKQGCEIVSIQADVTKPEALGTAWRKIKARFGQVAGVMHCAGILRDGFVADKSHADARAVLAAKLDALRELDKLSAAEPLGFFAACGSITGALGNLGQSDYAFANGAMAGFLAERQGRADRSGVSLCFDWPFWAEGGMALDAARLAQLARETGLAPLPTPQAQAAFLAGVSSANGHREMPLMVSNQETLRDFLGGLGLPTAKLPAAAAAVQPVPTRFAAPEGTTPIAVIGLAGEYPQAPDIATFWENLKAGVDAITPVPQDRWDHAALFSADRSARGKVYTEEGGFIADHDRFEADFFNITPREAKILDPQERRFLQTAWSAVESAGRNPRALEGREVGVFVGAMWGQYQHNGPDADGSVAASIFSAIANRVSYTLNLCGPSMAVDTMCSSSLTAVHLAMESLARGECEMAIAGGVNLMTHPHKFQFLCQNQMLSEDSRCRSFGEGGSGYVPGEGVGAIVLKPLEQALLDGDPVQAVLLASAVNHGGRAAGMTVPSPEAQAQVIGAAHTKASTFDRVSYIEAHGTGTSLGDPIEVSGLRKAFAGSKLERCALGAVKSNIGHLEGAAGIASITKTVLQLRHETLVGSLHADRLNPKLGLGDTPFHVQTTLTPWTGADRIAGVSAFGAGGSNAHIVIGAAPERPVAADVAVDAEGPATLVISARTPDTLRRYAQNWAAFLEAPHKAAFAQIAATSVKGREAFAHRIALAAETADEAAGALRGWLASQEAQPGVIATAHGQSAAARAAAAFVAGESIEATPAVAGRVEVPTYPFGGERYAIAPQPLSEPAVEDDPTLGRTELRPDGVSFVKSWDASEPLIADHKIGGSALMPAALMLETARAALRETGGEGLQLTSAKIGAPVALDGPKSLACHVFNHGSGVACEISHETSGALVLQVTAEAGAGAKDLPALPKGIEVVQDDPYADFAQKGLEYGPNFRCLIGAARDGDGTWVQIDLPAQPDWRKSALAMDAAMQAVVLAGDAFGEDDATWLPAAFFGVSWHGNPARAAWVRVTPLESTQKAKAFSISLADAQGALLWHVERFELHPRAQAPAAKAPEVAAPVVADIHDRLRDKLAELLAAECGLPQDKVRRTDTFNDLGVDSVMVMNMTFKLEQVFGELPKSLFFERTGIADLARWLEAEHGAAAQGFVGAVSKPKATAKPAKAAPRAAAPKLKSLRNQAGGGAVAEPLAVIGMAGRFPDADDIDALWGNLSRGHNAVSTIPEDRWPADLFRNSDGRKGDACGFGAFLDDVSGFDAGFFGMTPIDAKRADPAERLILETAWGAVEHAGYSRKALKGRAIGVFVASMWQQYQHYGLDQALRGGQMSSVSLLSSTASRISGMLGVTGPCLALDTMCSGSLTALHLARQAIANGDCEAAVVGGVNLSLHPHKYLTLSAGGFLSKKGQCASFGAEADGYVPGEGAAAVLVKPLSRALADGDPVHGVVLGTAVNHIGGTNGTTVPSASAQTEVIKSAIKAAGIDAAKISYVECHGTGTALGDPIELEGLNGALSHERPHAGCHIGSIKSNMGHAEAAAGVIGMIKVLLQMKHEQLAPTLHIETVNPALSLEKTPFTLVDALQDWQPGAQKFAAVSAFGAGGSNANVVLASAPDQPAATPDEDHERLFAFSGSSDATLRAQLQATAAWLDAHPNASAEAVAATLALGREDQACRFAVVADTLGDLRAHIARFLDGAPAQTGAFVSPAQASDRLRDFFDDIEGQTLVSVLLGERRLTKLAQFWCGGVEIDWAPLYAEGQPRVSMPGSAFDRQPLMFDHALESYAVQFDNTSDLSEQSYHIEMPAGHPVIADHVIDGKRQVSLALMMRLAHEGLLRADPDTDWTVSLDVLRPWFVDDRLTCDLRILPGRSGLDVVVEVDGTPVATGMAQPDMADSPVLAPVETGEGAVFSGPVLYDDFDRDGYAYGPHYAAIGDYQIAGDTVSAALGPVALDDPFGPDRLRVGTLDAALQLSRPLLESRSSAGWLPVKVALTVRDGAAQAARVVTRIVDSTDSETGLAVQWISADGQVVAHATATLAARQETVELDKTLTVGRSWAPVQLPKADAMPSLVSVGGKLDGATTADSLGAALSNATSDSLTLVLSQYEAQEVDILTLWRFVRDARKAGIETLRLAFAAPALTPHLHGLTSWLRALSEEMPTIAGRILVSETGPDAAVIAQAFAQDHVLLRQTSGGWEAPAVEPVELAGGTQPAAPNLTDHVVLITGGAGGLGRVMARHLARKGAHPILVGRSAGSDATESFVSGLRQIGSEAVYYACDLFNPKQVAALKRRIDLRFGRIDGVVHAAGVTSDAWLMDQTEDSVASVLAPKVGGTDQLIALLGDYAPQWCASFGSISGFLGNPGQTDYSYANAYMDAALRDGLGQSCKVVNLSWPLWKDIGMQVDPKMLDIMHKRFGMRPLPVATGVAAFDRALAQEAGSYLITYGDPHRIAAWLGTKEAGVPVIEAPAKAPAPAPAPPASAPAVGAAETPQTPAAMAPQTPSVSADALARQWVAEAVQSETQITPDRLDWQKPIDQFGISSVMSTSIVAFLEERCGASLPATLMFECQTWGEVAQWLIDNGFAVSHGTAAPAPVAPIDTAATAQAAPQKQQKKKNKAKGSRFAKMVPEIAIVGAACRMPGADSLDAFWDVIAEGRDMVTPIPEDRWPWSRFASTKAKEAMKGGFLNNVKRFDYPFFGIFHKEARSMDPQERLILETSWHALEDAGIAPSSLSDKPVGVYMGAMWNQYQMLARELWDQAPAEAAANGSASAIANRLSFLLNLAGPSLTLDTMCSSSLMALKLASDALRSGEIDMAIVGGVNTTLHPFKYHQLQTAQFLSPEGRCGAFGEGGDGYVPSEGVGVIVLRREEDAHAAGDRIRARVKGIGVSHGGRANGFTVPRPQKQAAAILAALKDGDIAANSVSYVEAHGTGTALGDPIEMSGLKSSYLRDRDGEEGGDVALSIGSVKANIGHAESAAGMASLCKVLLQLEHGKLAPSIHADPPNPDLGIDGTGISVQRELADWVPATPAQKVRRAGLSGFGAGGTNVHVILEEAPSEPKRTVPAHGHEVITLSARDAARLQDLVRAMLPTLETQDVSALAAATQLGRDPLKARLALVVKDAADLDAKLRRWLGGEQSADLWSGTVDLPDLCPVEGRDLSNAQDARALAQAWAEGADVDWSQLWPAGTPRATLPLYPFEEIEVWLGDESQTDPVAVMTGAQARTTPATQPAALVAPAAQFAPPQVAAPAPTKAPVAAAPSVDHTQILVDLLCETFRLDPDDLSVDMTFDRIGMDSVAASDCAKKLGDAVGQEIDPTWFFNHPTVRQMADALDMSGTASVVPAAETTTAPERAVAHPTADPVAPASKPGPIPAPMAAATADEPIAIVGLSGAFAGAADLDQFWENLAAGKDSVSEISPDRWDIDAFHSDDQQEPGKTISRRMGQLGDIDKFDPAAFNLMPDEVRAMDPQQRLFIKHAALALDHAGLAPERLDGTKCGVFAGTMTGSYRAFLEDEGDGFSALSMLGNHAAALPARVAFWLNLTGPTMAVDTACSSSLVSVHLACQAIRNGECTMALAGGVFVSPGPQEMISSSQAGMLSPSGSCKTFDDSADGIALGEGAGVLVLKPLSAALEHGDPIHAVLRASGVNQDGRTNGLTAPNALSQAELIRDVLAQSGLTADQIDYVECHGTGTKLGDPVEVEGLKRALGDQRTTPLPIGSVKPNVGHCYAAAGVASLIKVILAMKNRALPPSIHCQTGNSLIDFEAAKMQVNTKLTPWEATDGPRVAAISAFGYSGTNAHLIVEEAPARPDLADPQNPVVLPLSARKPALAVAQAHALARFLRNNPVPLEALAHTLQTGRRVEACRLVCVASTLDDAIRALQAMDEIDVKRVRDQKADPVSGDAEALAKAWMSGTPRIWPHHPHLTRVSVPGKCFAETRIWPGKAAQPASQPDCATPDTLPPLRAKSRVQATKMRPIRHRLKRITQDEFAANTGVSNATRH